MTVPSPMQMLPVVHDVGPLRLSVVPSRTAAWATKARLDPAGTVAVPPPPREPPANTGCPERVRFTPGATLSLLRAARRLRMVDGCDVSVSVRLPFTRSLDPSAFTPWMLDVPVKLICSVLADGMQAKSVEFGIRTGFQLSAFCQKLSPALPVQLTVHGGAAFALRLYSRAAIPSNTANGTTFTSRRMDAILYAPLLLSRCGV